jgi:hypothetical protein
MDSLQLDSDGPAFQSSLFIILTLRYGFLQRLVRKEKRRKKMVYK